MHPRILLGKAKYVGMYEMNPWMCFAARYNEAGAPDPPYLSAIDSVFLKVTGEARKGPAIGAGLYGCLLKFSGRFVLLLWVATAVTSGTASQYSEQNLPCRIRTFRFPVH